MKRLGWWGILLLALVICSYAVLQYGFFGVETSGFISDKIEQYGPQSKMWYVTLFVHVFGSLCSLLLGPFLLSERFRKRNINVHKMMGKVYLLSVFIGGISGLLLAFYATGGLIAQVGFGLLAVSWLLSGLIALKMIKEQKILLHRKWMMRNYALTFAAVMLRIWLPIFILIFGEASFHISYQIISWLCWVPNLIVVELVMRSQAFHDNALKL